MTKFEIRISKSETNSNAKKENPKQESDGSFFVLGFQICFGFDFDIRISDLQHT